jgi:hypothetical protein
MATQIDISDDDRERNRRTDQLSDADTTGTYHTERVSRRRPSPDWPCVYDRFSYARPYRRTSNTADGAPADTREADARAVDCPWMSDPRDASTDGVAPDGNTAAEPYDHHRGRSSAATMFYPTEDVDDPQKQNRLERLKGWNDGTRDSYRQQWEGMKDKHVWADSHGKRLSLPSSVVDEAQRLLGGLGDLRQLGSFNGLHRAVLAALTAAYRRHWLRRGYRRADNDDAKRWCEREDFKMLWRDRGLTEEKLRDLTALLNKKTDV